MHSRVAVLAAVLMPLAVGAHAQFQTPSLEGGVPDLRIDAVVTGPGGHPIRGLRASDFEVREAGESRPVSTAEFRWVPRRSTVEVFPIETRVDEERAARQPGTRVFAFFLDEFHVSPGASADRARQAVASFVDEKLFERDLAAVIRPLDALSSVRFTRDRSVLHGSINAFAGRRGEYAPRTPLEERLVGRDPTTATVLRHRIVRANLRQLGERLGELQADRAVIVLLSEGFPADDLTQGDATSDLTKLVRDSSRFHFPIYTFNPGRPHDDGVSAEASGEGDKATLQWLAVETGGQFVHAGAFIEGFARVFHETHGYYALTYRPAHADGKFHALEVRTRRAPYVRTRATYWATPNDWGKAPRSSRQPTEPVAGRLLRRSALIEVWVGVRHNAAGGASVIVTWESRKDESRHAETLVVKARTITGTPIFEGVIEPVRGVSAPAKDSARFDAPAGRLELDMLVLAGDGRVLDTDSRDVDVPDLRLASNAAPVLLPTEIVRVRTLGELQTASVNSDATPSSARTFARRDHLLVRVRSFDPTLSGARVAARVLNRTGQPMREIEATDAALGDGVTQFILPLYWLAPGPYQIEVSGTNAHGTGKERLAIEVK